MKYKGSVLEFSEQRNRELLKTYHRVIQDCDVINISQISVIIANSPCSRFWVTEERAKQVIDPMLKGDYHELDKMRPTKREMFLEIFHRLQSAMERHPKESVTDLLFNVINSPAPKFYLQARSAMEYIYKVKKAKKCKNK